MLCMQTGALIVMTLNFTYLRSIRGELMHQMRKEIEHTEGPAE